MTINIDSLFKNADPVVADILNNALSEKEIPAKDGLELFNVKGVHVGPSCRLQIRRVGDTKLIWLIEICIIIQHY